MYKTTVKEVTEKFDTDGNLVERTTRTETTEDDNVNGGITANPYIVTPTWDSPACTSVTSTGDIQKDNTTYTATDTTRSGIGIK